MRRREAAEPLLVVCDGAPGMIRAIDGMPAAHRASALPFSSNRTCGFPCIRLSDKIHAFTHDGPRPSCGYLRHRRSRGQH
jgi:hypothetical protein